MDVFRVVTDSFGNVVEVTKEPAGCVSVVAVSAAAVCCCGIGVVTAVQAGAESFTSGVRAVGNLPAQNPDLAATASSLAGAMLLFVATIVAAGITAGRRRGRGALTALVVLPLLLLTLGTGSWGLVRLAHPQFTPAEDADSTAN